MFGFIVANVEALSPEELKRYRGAYCGLCRALQERHGELSRLTLSYDMSFLVLLLSAMYEPEERSSLRRCLIHPAQRRESWRSRFSDYAADMTVALAYYNCLDDWEDDRRLGALAEARALRRHYTEVAERWPEQCAALETCMAELAAIEQQREDDPDAAANCFGKLMGALFAPEEDSVWQPRLRAFGAALGRFIYLMDACVDRERDRKKGSYNPLLVTECAALSDEELLSLLKQLMGECCTLFEALPIVQDAALMRNILYSGVWTQYAAAKKRREKKEKGRGEPA